MRRQAHAAALDWQGSIESDDAALGLFGELKAEAIHISNQIAQSDGPTIGENPYYARLAVGGVLANLLTVTYTRTFWGSDQMLTAGSLALPRNGPSSRPPSG